MAANYGALKPGLNSKEVSFLFSSIHSSDLPQYWSRRSGERIGPHFYRRTSWVVGKVPVED